jgi:LCP family protein required for cell wall assembly
MRQRLRHELPSPAQRIAAGFSALIMFVTVIGGSYAWALGALNDSDTIDTGTLGDRPDRADTGALNLLIMGIDDRAGTRFVDEGAGASDTTLLVHLYAGREKALVVSIPRDTMVDVPECTSADGKVLPPRREQFNAAYSQGGPTCTVRTVEAITGIYLDHFVTVNLAGFKSIVDSLGGVEMCLEEPIQSDKAHVNLPAGFQTLDGAQALGYVRARYVGDGSDLSRIERQQKFLRAMARKVTTVGIIANPIRLRGVLESTADAIATDPGLSSSNAKRDLATSLRALGSDGLTFVTAPVEPWSQNRNRVVFIDSEAQMLWRAIREDAPWPPIGTLGIDGEPLRAQPQDVRVTVLNGTPTAGLARSVADELAALGFIITSVGNADRNDYEETQVRHDSAYDESARTLATVSGTRTLTVDDSLNRSVVLVVGADWTGATPVVVSKQKIKATPAATPEPSITSPQGPQESARPEETACRR